MSRPTALVTGGSSGIGLALSRRLARAGRDLVWAALNPAEMEEARALIAQESPQARVETIAVDLADPAAAREVFDRAETAAGGAGVDLLVNNAGFGVYGPSAALAPERETAMVAVNAAAPLALIRLFLEAMQARGRGAIVNICSNSAFLPTPRMAVYAATKAFLRHYSEALHEELKLDGSPVRVMTVCPAAVRDTPFRAAAGAERARTFASFTATTADEVAADVMRGLERGARTVISGRAMRRTYALMKIAPAPLLRWMVRRETAET